MKPKYVKSGQFAALCGVTKETLFHYEKIGLVKPVKVGDNGYRYYTVQQAYVLDVIQVLKDVGFTLQEIKQYISQRNTTSFIHTLETAAQTLALEIQSLQHVQALALATAGAARQVQQHPLGKIDIVSVEAEYFFVTPAEEENNELAATKAFANHLIRCRQESYCQTFTGGEIVSVAEIQHKTYRPQYYCTKLQHRIIHDDVVCKPAGMYAVTYVQHTYENLQDVYAWFVQAVQEKGHTLKGPIYETDIIDHVAEREEDNYVLKIEGLIERQIKKDAKASFF